MLRGAGPLSSRMALLSILLIAKVLIMLVATIYDVHAAINHNSDALSLGERALSRDPLGLFTGIALFTDLITGIGAIFLLTICGKRGAVRVWRTDSVANAATWLLVPLVVYHCLQYPCEYYHTPQAIAKGPWEAVTYVLLVARVLRDVLSITLILSFKACVRFQSGTESETSPLLGASSWPTPAYNNDLHPVVRTCLQVDGIVHHLLLLVTLLCYLAVRVSWNNQLPACRQGREETILLFFGLAYHTLVLSLWWRSWFVSEVEAQPFVEKHSGQGSGNLTFNGQVHTFDNSLFRSVAA